MVLFHYFWHHLVMWALVNKNMTMLSTLNWYPYAQYHFHHLLPKVFGDKSLPWGIIWHLASQASHERFLKWLLSGATMIVSGALYYNGWSKVTVMGMLWFMARLFRKSNVDRMYDLSQEYISIIGKNLTNDCPKCLCSLD